MCVLPTDGQGQLLAWPGIIFVFGERVTQGKRRRFSAAMASSRIYPAENFYCDLEKELSVSGPAASLPGRNEARIGFPMLPTFRRSPTELLKCGFTCFAC